MEKQEFVVVIDADKKHSVQYKPLSNDAAVTSIYVMRRCLGPLVPKRLKVTLEEE